ncbi:MAG: DUF1697 domain-containing protein [candidate division Zixibacteria bacterium]|nr:DUF1697 domain-containing protein [candidate division Zixibacteria bacterium]
MTRFVAFLRAINVGGHVVKMDLLRRVFADSLELANVETFIASGNVLFDATSRNTAALEKKIAAQLEKALGYEVATFIRSDAELIRIAEYQPFKPKDVQAAEGIYVGFLAGELAPSEIRMVKSFRSDVDELEVNGREIYWLCRIRSTESDFSLAKLEKTLRIQATFRNITTVRKIAALLSAE